MNLSELSIKQLSELIQAASAEISARLAEPIVERVKAERPVVVLREPPAEDKDFILYIAAIIAKSGYIKAEERDRVADIAVEYGPWVKRQGLPIERGTGPWRKLAQRNRVKPARER